MKLKGKVHKYGANVNTDVIIPARYLNVSDPDELAKHCMEDIDAYFLKNMKKGDIIMATTNFGCGSSREHAPLAIKAVGISSAVVEKTESGDVLEVDLEKGEIKNTTKNMTFSAEPYPRFMGDLIKAGGLIEYTKKRLANRRI
jgi:3-isopropylmalate/(R)-2-methylmalate dehydratase small subunit